MSAQDRTHEEWLIVAAKMAGYEEFDDDHKQQMDVSNELSLRRSYGGPDPDPTGTARLQGKKEVLDEKLKGRRFRTLHFRPDTNHHHMAEVIDGMNTGQVECWGRCLRRRQPGPLWKLASAPPSEKFKAFIEMMRLEELRAERND